MALCGFPGLPHLREQNPHVQPGVGPAVAFSKFDPHRPQEDAHDGASSASAARRAKVLKWVNLVVLVYTAIGFGFIAYWLVKAN